MDATLTANSTVGGGVINFTSPQTVLRMLGEYVIDRNAAIVAGDACRVGIGIAKVSADAAALGATAMPDPLQDYEFPWLFQAEHRLWWPAPQDATSVNNSGSGSGIVRRSFDIRSMRKFKPNESLVQIVQYIDSNGTPPTRFFSTSTRVLTTIH